MCLILHNQCTERNSVYVNSLACCEHNIIYCIHIFCETNRSGRTGLMFWRTKVRISVGLWNRSVSSFLMLPLTHSSRSFHFHPKLLKICSRNSTVERLKNQTIGNNIFCWLGTLRSPELLQEQKFRSNLLLQFSEYFVNMQAAGSSETTVHLY